MKDLEEQSIQAELDKISKHIDAILNRVKNLDPVSREVASENKNMTSQ